MAIDEHLGPASIAAINKAGADKLMGQLIVQSQVHYRVVAVTERASADEVAS